MPAKNSNRAVQNISFLNLKQEESHSCNMELFHVAHYNIITPDLAFVMMGFLPTGEYCASGVYSAGGKKKQAATAQYHSGARLHRTLIIMARCACAYREIFVCSGCFPIGVYICGCMCKWCVLVCGYVCMTEGEGEREIERENSSLQFPCEALYTNFQPWAITHSAYTST